MKLGFIGGDLRIVRLMEMYLAEKNEVYCYGFENYFEKAPESNLVQCKTLDEVIENCTAILSGMPFSKDKVTVNAPFAKKEIQVEELKNKLCGKTFIAGGIPENFEDGSYEVLDTTAENLKKCKINCIDLLKNEELTILNAIPTVEGTIKIAIEEREETIHESNVLICGFGRIGKILCDRFQKLGANVYCAARKDADFAWIRENRYIPVSYTEVPDYGRKFDIIINTVPHLVISPKELTAFSKEVLIIDLASYPGGIDNEYAKTVGIKVITALGIPGKEMPKTAGKYMKKVIDKFLEK